MERLLEVMRALRGPNGCPWDKQQTHQSLRPYLLEEAAEAVDAIGEGSVPKMVEELGDVLLQVAFHSVIGEQEGTFRYADVERTIVEKLIRRHPHVFGDREAHTAAEVLANWERQKERERGPQPPCEQVPRALPALMRAQALQEKLNYPQGSPDRVREALEAGDLGRLLFEVVALCRKENVNPEVLLRETLDAICSERS